MNNTVITYLIPQSSPKGGYQYFCAIDGKATVINAKVKSQTEYAYARIRIIKDLDNIQFAVITEMLESLPISKLDIIEYFKNQSGVGLFSSSAALQDKVLCKKQWGNAVYIHFCAGLRSSHACFVKTKYGITQFPYNHFIGSWLYEYAPTNLTELFRISYRDWHKAEPIQGKSHGEIIDGIEAKKERKEKITLAEYQFLEKEYELHESLGDNAKCAYVAMINELYWFYEENNMIDY